MERVGWFRLGSEREGRGWFLPVDNVLLTRRGSNREARMSYMDRKERRARMGRWRGGVVGKTEKRVQQYSSLKRVTE